MRSFWDSWGVVLFLAMMAGLVLHEADETDTVSEVISFETESERYLRLKDEHAVTVDWIENARNDPTTGDYFIRESSHGTEIVCVNMGGSNGYACE